MLMSDQSFKMNTGSQQSQSKKDMRPEFDFCTLWYFESTMLFLLSTLLFNVCHGIHNVTLDGAYDCCVWFRCLLLRCRGAIQRRSDAVVTSEARARRACACVAPRVVTCGACGARIAVTCARRCSGMGRVLPVAIWGFSVCVCVCEACRNVRGALCA
jgi:hypothetical protein